MSNTPYENNKHICNIFNNDLNTNRIVIYFRRGLTCGYIISKENFRKFDYWNINYWTDGSQGLLDLPYLYKSESYPDWGTVDILVDLITNSIKFHPNNGCKYAKNEHDLEIDFKEDHHVMYQDFPDDYLKISLPEFN